MHKEWQRINTGDDIDWDKPYRTVSQYSGRHDTLGSAWFEHEVEVRDADDEPLDDGLYEDSSEDRWIRLNGRWAPATDAGYSGAWMKWDGDDMAEYAPYKLIDPSDY